MGRAAQDALRDRDEEIWAEASQIPASHRPIPSARRRSDAPPLTANLIRSRNSSTAFGPKKEAHMRIVIAAIPLLLLGACQVSKDNANGTTSVAYNSDVAENAAADVGNTLQNVAGDIGNDVSNESAKVQNKVGDNDKDNTQANATENK